MLQKFVLLNHLKSLLEIVFLKLYCFAGYSWAERHAAGRQEAPGAKSKCGIQERHPGECPSTIE